MAFFTDSNPLSPPLSMPARRSSSRSPMLDGSWLAIWIVLQLTACGSDGTPGDSEGPAVEYHRISQTNGGFSGALADYDKFGYPVVAIGDVDGDGFVDLAVGASWDEDESFIARGAFWILFMN